MQGGDALQSAIEWCADFGLGFDAHNANLPELIARYGNDCRKVGADYYCDDKSYFMGAVSELIQDSGTRREFESGAVRDMAEGKGRCDLLPMCALLRLARHYEQGAKYADRNWEGYPVS